MMKKILPLLTLAAMILVMSNCIITTRSTVRSPRPVVHSTTRVEVVGPPVIVIQDDDPELVVIPNTYVYWLDGQDDVYFYGGYWWRPYRGGWYRASSYSGSWVSVHVNVVPRPVMHLPSGWRGRYREAPRVRWQDARSNHHRWERDRYWEKRKWKKAPPPPPKKRSRTDPF
jgi:hypothetical protein